MPTRAALRVIPKYDPTNNIGAVDRVRFCLINNRMDELTIPEQEQLERWKQIDSWIRQKRFTINLGGISYEENVIAHSRLRNLVMKFFSVSWDTAERDIANTKNFCGAVYDDQEYYRSVYIEDFEELAAKADAAGDYKAAIKAKEEAGKLRKLYEKPVDRIPNDKIRNLQFIIEYNPEAIGLKTVENKEELFEKWLSQNRSASDRMSDDAEEAEYVD